MKKNFIAAISAFIITISSLSAQEKTFIHYRVNKGETVSKIARENGIPVSDLLKYNPDAKGGIKEGSFLLIPTQSFLEQENKKKQQSTEKTENRVTSVNTFSGNSDKGGMHFVKPKETLYSISRQYNISIDELYKLNPSLKEEGLKAETYILVVPQEKKNSIKEVKESKDVTGLDQSKPRYTSKLPSASADTIKDINNIYFKYIDVEPQNTLYGLAVLYNTTIQRLMELNPELKDGLKSGQKIKVPAYGFSSKEEIVEVTPIVKEDGYKTVIVEPKQTLYSLSRQYGITIEELVKLNPKLKDGLRSGMELKIPTTGGSTEDIEVNENIEVSFKNNFADLESSVSKRKRREIALLLPFNVSRLGDDISAKLQSDAFLNMTLDFYSGAKIAIEHAEKLGLPLTVNVYDSNESKTSSNVGTLLQTKDFSDTDVIIGPFFQSNLEQTINKLPNKDIVVISPLSNEKLVASSQLVQTMPYADVLRVGLLDYFVKNNNVKLTVIVDDKRASTKRFMQNYYPNVKVISTSLINDVDKTLVSGKTNVFVLDSSSIESASLLTTKLKKRIGDFDIQLASFDKGDVFDSSEIDIESLVALKYTYPSVTRDNKTNTDNQFQQEYREKYNISPNRFATRGYDVTYDVILRLFQGSDFMNTIKYQTQAVENKFIYSRSPEGSIRNTGVYLLQYTDDLTVKVLQ